MCLSKNKSAEKVRHFSSFFFPLIRIRFTQNTQNTRVYFFARESSEGDQRRFSSVRGRSTSQRKRREKDAREKKGDADTRGRRRRDVWRSEFCDESNAKSLRRDDAFGESKQRRDASTTTTTTRRWWRTVRERREWKSIGERGGGGLFGNASVNQGGGGGGGLFGNTATREHSGLALNNNNNNKAVVVVDCSETRPRHPLVVVVVVDCLVRRVERERDATRRAFRQCE